MQHVHFILVLLRLFKGHFASRFYHAVLEIVLGRFQIALQNVVNLLHVAVVFRFGLFAFAGAFAVADVVFQADFVLARFDVFGREVVVAGANRVQLTEHIQHGVHGFQVSKRPVKRTLFRSIRRVVSTRGKVLIGDADEGVRFVIAQQNIELRLVSFDELVFQQQRVELGMYDGEFDFPNLTDQSLRFAVVSLEFVK